MTALGTFLWLRGRLAIHRLGSHAGAADMVAGTALVALAAIGALAIAGGLGLVVHIATLSGDGETVRGAWTVALYTMAIFGLVVPLVVGGGRSAFDPSRFLVFPVSRRALYHLALTTELVSGTHLVWYPMLLTTVMVGIVVPGPERPWSLVVVLLFAAGLVVWEHSIGLIARILLSGRRVREIAAVLGLGLVVLVGMLPAAVDITADNADQKIGELLTIPRWLAEASAALPPSVAADGLCEARVGHSVSAAVAAFHLALWLAAGWGLGLMLLARLLRREGESGGRERGDRRSRFRSNRGCLLDRLPATVGAVAGKEVRYLLHSGTGKVSLLVMPVMTALTALLTGRHGGMLVLGLDLQEIAFFGIMIYGATLTGYSQVNAFAWENAGMTIYFTSPVSLHRVILGKNLGVWLFNVAFACEGLAVWSVVRRPPHPSTVVTGLLLFASTTILLSIVGNFVSVATPVRRPVSSVTSTASPTGTLVMIGGLLAGASIAGLVVMASSGTATAILRPILAIAAVAVLAGLYRVSLARAAPLLSRRREDVLGALGVG